jgi:hypothetical protein
MIYLDVSVYVSVCVILCLCLSTLHCIDLWSPLQLTLMGLKARVSTAAKIIFQAVNAVLDVLSWLN